MDKKKKLTIRVRWSWLVCKTGVLPSTLIMYCSEKNPTVISDRCALVGIFYIMKVIGIKENQV